MGVPASCERSPRSEGEKSTRTQLLDGLPRIGIDEISYRKGHRYLTVVVDHDSGRLVWISTKNDRATVHAFLDEFAQERCKKITLLSG